MPRPPSELTGSNMQIAVRVTKSLREEFHNMGGAIWLRKLLATSIEQKRKQQEKK
jgi:hypothetical protein